MSNEIKGTVHAVLPLESGVGKTSGQPWSRQTVVIKWDETHGDFTKTCYLALQNSKKAVEFGRLQVGDVIEAKYEVTSREYNGKWYHDVNCFAWRVESASAPAYAPPAAPGAPAAPSAPAAPAAPASDPNSLEPQPDDLPFA